SPTTRWLMDASPTERWLLDGRGFIPKQGISLRNQLLTSFLAHRHLLLTSSCWNRVGWFSRGGM
ncbi:hypothetical protein Ancab_004379, partial [Ancistrocladus abbreviatus]